MRAGDTSPHELLIPTLDLCYLLVRFFQTILDMCQGKIWRASIDGMHSYISWSVKITTPNCIVLISSQKFKDMGCYPFYCSFLVFLFIMQESFLKGKSNNSNDVYQQSKPHFIRYVISGKKGPSNLTKKLFSSISNITPSQTLLTSADITSLLIVFKNQFPMLYRCNRYCA